MRGVTVDCSRVVDRAIHAFILRGVRVAQIRR